MAGKLNTFVHVDGRAYGPGDVVPPEVAQRITNPDVWASDTTPTAVPESTTTDVPPPPTQPGSDTATGDVPATSPGGESPRRGRKSS